ncbi:MAG: haloacid dehalogenase-like hydrolase, partial [Bacteroidales bacterium]|nr:haloacid dehalogenase-like hydrolase [Bacteroidales bacterium]
MRKIAVFDFCETLVTFQTADAFVDYVRQKNGTFYMKFLEFIFQVLKRIKIFTLFNKFFPGLTFSKKLKLFQLKGIPCLALDGMAQSYYLEIIRPNFIHIVLEEMKMLIQKGFEACIISAGYSIYLKYFTREYGIKHLIASEIACDIKKEHCLGRLSGKDCYGSEKISRLERYFKGTEINTKESIAYSDSISDLPLLLY